MIRRLFLLFALVALVTSAVAMPPSVAIAVPVASWDACRVAWTARQMDVELGYHPRMITPSGDTVVVAIHRWTIEDSARISEMRAAYGWPVIVNRDTLTTPTYEDVP